jgi:hypothetical protein
VPCLRTNDQRGDVFAEKKIRIKGPVKEENKLVIGMIRGYPSKSFKRKPSDSFQFSFKQQSGINGYNWQTGLVFANLHRVYDLNTAIAHIYLT